jgi:DNA invertase Pin-like site-specific DNA recombinase
MMKLGYARVSTNEQDTAAQVSALKSAGCEKIFREKASGGRWDRPELHRLLDQLRKGDVLIVARLDRLSRSLRDVLMIMERIKEAEAGFKSLTEAIDTTTAPGRMMMQMVGAFAEFERAILRERTKAGLEAARKRGCIGGRRPKLRPVQQDEIVAAQIGIRIIGLKTVSPRAGYAAVDNKPIEIEFRGIGRGRGYSRNPIFKMLQDIKLFAGQRIDKAVRETD